MYDLCEISMVNGTPPCRGFLGKRLPPHEFDYEEDIRVTRWNAATTVLQLCVALPLGGRV